MTPMTAEQMRKRYARPAQWMEADEVPVEDVPTQDTEEDPLQAIAVQLASASSDAAKLAAINGILAKAGILVESKKR